MSARDDILGRLRAAAGTARPGIAKRLEQHPRGPQLARVALDAPALVDLFHHQAEAAAATVARVRGAEDVPEAVAAYLARENLPARVVMAPDPPLDDIPWSARPLIEIRRGASDGNDLVSVTGCFAAVAETGTLMLTSGPDHPTTLNFLPETHVVVVRAAQVVGPIEDAWDRLRAARSGMPRAVNFVTGPSRSADIGQELQMGAHGPRRLHIVLVEDGVSVEGGLSVQPRDDGPHPA